MEPRPVLNSIEAACPKRGSRNTPLGSAKVSYFFCFQMNGSMYPNLEYYQVINSYLI